MARLDARYDVVVAGGGTAGMAAAVAAARSGARTLLLERYGFLGGMATAGMVGTICGLFLGGTSGTPERLNDGLTGEITDRIARLPGSAPPLRRGRTFVVPYVPHELAGLADALTGAEPALDTRLHAYLTAVTTSTGAVASVRFQTWEGSHEVACSALVDASGDAIAAVAAGAATATPDVDARQLCSLVFVVQGVSPGAVGGSASVAVLRRLAAAEAAGSLPLGASDVSWRPSGRPGEVVGKLALRSLALDAEDDWLTAAERAGRARVATIGALLQREVPGFAASFVSHVAPQVGVRESRRIVGRYGLTRDDVLGGRRFEDAIARAAWPIELWRDDATGVHYEYLADGDWYEVPLGCLEASGVGQLLAAGRCISGTSEALGSARVIGTCLATGEAAGRAAARIAEGRGA
jgi:FAD-dependent oxidoreductase family protein